MPGIIAAIVGIKVCQVSAMASNRVGEVRQAFTLPNHYQRNIPEGKQIGPAAGRISTHPPSSPDPLDLLHLNGRTCIIGSTPCRRRRRCRIALASSRHTRFFEWQARQVQHPLMK